MRDQIKRIISEVAEGSADWASKHKKSIGGVGAAGAAGALSSDQVADLYKKGIGMYRRAIGVGDAVEKADSQDAPPFITAPIPPVMYGYRFPEPGCIPCETGWEGLRDKK